MLNKYILFINYNTVTGLDLDLKHIPRSDLNRAQYTAQTANPILEAWTPLGVTLDSSYKDKTKRKPTGHPREETNPDTFCSAKFPGLPFFPSRSLPWWSFSFSISFSLSPCKRQQLQFSQMGLWDSLLNWLRR